MLTPEEEADLAMINKSLCALIKHFENKNQIFILGWSLQKRDSVDVVENLIATKAGRAQYINTTAQWTRHALDICDAQEGFTTFSKRLHE